MKFLIDPNRATPGRSACYEYDGTPASTSRCAHLGWRHPKSWDEVQDWLEAELLVADKDGDAVESIVASERYGEEWRDVRLVNDSGVYHYRTYQILIEDHPDPVEPVTDEEEAEALASIQAALGLR